MYLSLAVALSAPLCVVMALDWTGVDVAVCLDMPSPGCGAGTRCLSNLRLGLGGVGYVCHQDYLLVRL